MQSRRRFLMLATGSLAGCGLLRLYSSRSSAADKSEEKSLLPPHAVERRGFALGSEISLVAIHSDRATAEKALAASFAELELIENVMSIYRPQSELSRLNAAGKLDKPHAYLVDVLRAAQKMAERSNGAFDVTVQPLWQLYTDCRKQNRLPKDTEVQAARSKVGWKKLEVDGACVRLGQRGMAVTLNGIAQGYATDRVLSVMKAHGIADALINTGEIGSLGHKTASEAWRVGVQHPRKPDSLSAVVPLDGRCLSTSGDYATYFSDDFIHNHIFDPATGDSPRELSSVSVLAETGTAADALSTAIFVCGADKGLALLDQHNADALLIDKCGKCRNTRGFPITS